MSCSLLASLALRLVFVLLDHTGDISLLTQSLELFIVKQGLDNMLKNKDTIKQVCACRCTQTSLSFLLARILKATSNNYWISTGNFPIWYTMLFTTIQDF